MDVVERPEEIFRLTTAKTAGRNTGKVALIVGAGLSASCARIFREDGFLVALA